MTNLEFYTFLIEPNVKCYLKFEGNYYRRFTLGVIKRQSIKATIVTYTGVLIAYLNILFLWPLCLKPDQIGLLRILPDVALILSIFVKFGLNSAAIKFFANFRNNEKGHNGLLFNLLFFPFILFILFTILFILFHDKALSYYLEKEPLLDKYIYWLLPLTFFTVYTTSFETYSNLHLRIVVPTLAKEIIGRSLTALVILLFYLKLYQFDTLVAVYTFSFGIITLIIMLYIKHLKKLFLKPNWKFLDKNLRKEIINYSLFIALGGIGSILAMKIDTIMVTGYLSLGATGVFSTAALIAVVIEMPKRAINQITGPIVADLLVKDDIKSLDSLYKKSSITQLVAGIFIFLVIWVNTDSLFRIMPNGATFQAGKYVIFFIGLSKLFDMATSINYIIINNSKFYKVSIYTMLFLAGVGIISNMIFIPILNITGAALATAISILLYNIICLWFVYHKYKIQPFVNGTIKIIIIGLICSGIYFLPQLFHPIIDIMIRTTLLTLTYAGMVYYLKVSEDVNGIYHQAIELIRKIIGK